MIIENYSTFRSLANPGGSIGADGLTEFDPSKMRANGFDDGIVHLNSIAFPLKLTCNVGALDGSLGVDEYDWYISQRTSVVAQKPFTVSRFEDIGMGTSYSGTILLQQRTWCAIEYPDPFDLDDSVPVLFAAIDVYAIRRSDGAIQRLDLMQYLIDALSPKVGVE